MAAAAEQSIQQSIVEARADVREAKSSCREPLEMRRWHYCSAWLRWSSRNCC
jgi:hypothetical protein